MLAIKGRIFLICFILTSFSLFAQWQQTNGPNGGLTMKIIRIEDYFFINGFYGGVFRSKDKTIWEAVNGEEFGDFPMCAEIQTDGNRLFSAMYGKGVFYSDDYGLTWHLLHDDPSVTNALVIDGNNIYSGSGNGMFYSENYGLNWQYFDGTNRTGYMSIQLEKKGDTLWIGSYNLFYSIDHGKNWNLAEADINSRNDIAIGYDGNLIFASGENNSQPVLYYSTNSGLNWSKSNLQTTLSIYSILVSGQSVYCGTSNSTIYYSTDGGQSWQTLKLPEENIRVLDLFLDNETLMAATSNGIFISEDNGSNWQQSNDGLVNTFITEIFAMNGRVYSNSIGESLGVFISEDQGDSWRKYNNGLMHYQNNRELPIYGFYSLGDTIYTATWSGVYNSYEEAMPWNCILDLSEQNGELGEFCGDKNRLIAQTSNALLTSLNGGNVWENINSDLNIHSVHVSGDTIVLGVTTNYGENIMVSTDGGSSWVNKDNNLAGIYNFPYVHDFAFWNNKLLAGTYEEGLLYSTDLGTTWNQIVQTIGLKINSISINEQVAYLCTETGLYFSDTDVDSWKSINKNMGETAIHSFTTDGEYGYVGTAGKGIWKTLMSVIINPCNLPVPVLSQKCSNLILSNYQAGNIQWVMDGQNIDLSGENPDINKSGEYWAIVTNECGSGISNKVQADLTNLNKPEKPLINSDCKEIYIDSVSDEIELKWYQDGQLISGIFSNKIEPEVDGWYYVELQNECFSTLSDSIKWTSAKNLQFYNVITPNNDRINDVFVVDEFLIGKELFVYNRWGNLIYYSQQYKNDWDGGSNPSGVYYYFIPYPCFNNIKGFVSILK